MGIRPLASLYAAQDKKVPEIGVRPPVRPNAESVNGIPPQCPSGLSSLLLVAYKIDATKAAMMKVTTTNGEEMCIAQGSFVTSD
jgi:hypothetical protein